jgi:ribosome-associated translation inhibitor RaiA
VAKILVACVPAESDGRWTVETPVEIDFQGEIPFHGLREKIVENLSQLEDRFGRIIGCRVVLKAPSSHHRQGSYEIHIHLTLPQGKEVIVAHTPDADERYADIDFALNDAFKRARRQLQDQARRLQGQVKTHRNEPQA